MDEYGQIGPGKRGYEDDVQQIRTNLTLGTPVNLKFAANSTAKQVCLVPWEACSVFSRPPGFSESDPLMVAIDNGKAAWMPTTNWLHPAYVGQYLDHPFGWHDVDDIAAEPFAHFLNDILGHAYPGATAAGHAVPD